MAISTAQRMRGTSATGHDSTSRVPSVFQSDYSRANAQSSFFIQERQRLPEEVYVSMLLSSPANPADPAPANTTKSKDKAVSDAIYRAIEVGYRHIDTAAIYETETDIGEALNKKFEEGGLWNTRHRREQVPEALRESLRKLGLSYVDLYLMHWPLGLNIHPQMVQSELVWFCHVHNIAVMGYSPLGTMVPRFGLALPGPKMDDPTLVGRLEENIAIFDFKLTEEEVQTISPGSTYRLTAPSFWQDHKDY
ncbi:3-dehydroecdysone 3beta-reductase, partial [Operophtera brumata]